MKFIVAIAAVLLASCGNVKLADYQSTQQKFNLIEYFSGETQAWGMVQDRAGKVTRRFKVDMQGVVRDGVLVLDEYFVYDDGEKQFRQWRISSDAKTGGYSGRADDIVGVASGAEAGFAVRWSYQMNLTVDDSQYLVIFDDWMYRLDDRRAFNRASIRKFGIEVAEVTLFFEKK